MHAHQNHKQLSHSERNVSIGCRTKGIIKQQRETETIWDIPKWQEMQMAGVR